MKNYTYYIVSFLIMIAAHHVTLGQGCVAVRNMSSCSTGLDSAQNKGFQISLNYRYFRSYKHFRGKHEEKHRVERGTEVINNDNSVLLGLSYGFNSRWSAAITIPYLSIDRSSLYEHYGNPTDEVQPLNPRFHTQSRGLGDLRLGVYRNIFENKPTTLVLGLGVKLPTGNYRTKDYFHKKAVDGSDSLVYKPVDQSIQLGDGGFGVTTEFDFSYAFTHTVGMYASGLYLFNPRNTNGVVGRNPSAGVPRSDEFSVADQFLFRLGARATYSQFQFSLGGRYEGIPSEDAIGKSDGWRRPGYILSLEPSVAFHTGKHTVGMNVPIALERNRVQNTIDKERTRITGTFQQGDAAFADWLLSISYSYKL